MPHPAFSAFPDQVKKITDAGRCRLSVNQMPQIPTGLVHPQIDCAILRRPINLPATVSWWQRIKNFLFVFFSNNDKSVRLLQIGSEL
jgi:hypothetical protein